MVYYSLINMSDKLALQRHFLSSFKWLRKVKKKIISVPPFHVVPPTIQVEPTNYCNLSCICCSAPRSVRKKGYMEFDLFKKIVDDASHIGVRKVSLFLHGEPLLHPEIIEMLRYIKTRNLCIELATNGLLFNKEQIDSVLKSGLRRDDTIRFSILGFSKEVHEAVQQGISHEVVLTNLTEFIEMRKKSGQKSPSTKITYYVIPENENEKDEFKRYWQGKVDFLSVGSASIKFREYKGSSTILSPRKTYCRDFWNRMTIFWNGDVSMCCVDVDGDYVVGNLEKQTIKEIWNGSQMSALRKLHKERQFHKLPLCSNCDF